MKTKRILTIASITAALAILTILENTESVHAQEIAAWTHLNVPERNVVNLVGTSTSNLREVNRDGVVANSDYTVPAGMALVITDITANVHDDDNVLIPLHLSTFMAANLRIIYRIRARTDRYGYVTTKDHFTAGLMVGSGNSLQLQGNRFLDITASVLGYTVPIPE